MFRRLILVCLVLTVIAPIDAGNAQTSRRTNTTGLLGISGPGTKPADDLNGRKRVIYDKDGRRDYRRGFDRNKVRDRQKMAFCQQYPADNDCFGRRF